MSALSVDGTCRYNKSAVMDYDQLYRQYFARVTGYLSTIVGAVEAEDLAQEVFIKVGNKLSQLKDPTRVSSWIFKIALNTARDRLRHPSLKKRGQEASSGPQTGQVGDTMEQVPDTRSRTAEEDLARREMIQCYVDFVEKLPKNYYDIYVLSEFEGLPDKIISKRLSLPLETVKMRLHRARTRLFEELRANCRCYYNERGELMGTRKQP